MDQRVVKAIAPRANRAKSHLSQHAIEGVFGERMGVHGGVWGVLMGGGGLRGLKKKG